MFGFCCNGLWNSGWWGGGWTMIIVWMFWLLLIGAGIWLVITLIRRNAQSPTSIPGPLSSPSSETALDILRARYARGEITREEFEDMRRAITD
jgi:putative membrane protein